MPNITASELKTSTVEATFFIETVGLSIKHDSRREGYISEIIVTEFYYFYHDLKTPHPWMCQCHSWILLHETDTRLQRTLARIKGKLFYPWMG